MRAPIETRFWAKVNKNGPIPAHVPEIGECWVWTAQIQPFSNGQGGYGRFDWPGGQLAHRYSWVLANGPVPPEQRVLHACDNRACVRPAHLFLGTPADNARDRDVKHRLNKKLKPEQIREIRQLLAGGTMQQKAIAELYGVVPATITHIKQGVRWSWLDTSAPSKED